ncbi:hypothetical protein KGO95_03215 [Patescibacteria group bacterium]|nr:hypothetical protein [Patescibacteria group bacterium]
MHHLRSSMEVIKRHHLVLSFALIVGLIYVGPYLFFAYHLGAGYQGINITRAPDEEGYLTIVNSLARRGIVGDPYIFEYRDLGNNVNYYSIEYFLAATANAFHVMVPDLILGLKFLAPAVLFGVVYLFTLELMGSSGGALFVALLVLLGNEVARTGLAAIPALFSGTVASTDFLTYARPVNPAESSILFFAVLWLILKLYKGERKFGSLPAAAAVGFAVGAMSYIYFYFWAFPLILCGVVLLYDLFTRNKEGAKRFFVALAASAFAAVPFFFNTAALFLAPPANGDFGAPLQKAFTRTHQIIPEKTILLPLVVFAVLYALWKYSKEKWGEEAGRFVKKYAFVALLLITGIIASNEQVITGIEVQQHHFHFYTNIPMLLIAVGIMVYELVRLIPHWWRVTALGGISLFVVTFAIQIQASSYAAWKQDFISYQRYAPVFSWLRLNSGTDTVVYADQTMSEMIPIYTQDYTYGSLHAAAYPVPVVRLEHNYFMTLFLRGVTKDDALVYLSDPEHRNEMGQYIFEGQYWKDMCGSYGCFPDATFKSLVNDYVSFLGNSFETNLKEYKVNYIVWDMANDPEWNLGGYVFLKEVYSGEQIKIFKVN